MSEFRAVASLTWAEPWRIILERAKGSLHWWKSESEWTKLLYFETKLAIDYYCCCMLYVVRMKGRGEDKKNSWASWPVDWGTKSVGTRSSEQKWAKASCHLIGGIYISQRAFQVSVPCLHGPLHGTTCIGSACLCLWGRLQRERERCGQQHPENTTSRAESCLTAS